MGIFPARTNANCLLSAIKYLTNLICTLPRTDNDGWLGIPSFAACSRSLMGFRGFFFLLTHLRFFLESIRPRDAHQRAEKLNFDNNVRRFHHFKYGLRIIIITVDFFIQRKNIRAELQMFKLTHFNSILVPLDAEHLFPSFMWSQPDEQHTFSTGYRNRSNWTEQLRLVFRLRESASIGVPYGNRKEGKGYSLNASKVIGEHFIKKFHVSDYLYTCIIFVGRSIS